MSTRYLLDTNVLSERPRLQPNPAVVRRVVEHEDEMATAAPVWHEMLWGVRRMPASRRREALERYLFDVVAATLPILPYDGPAADWHARERARLLALGRTPSFVDGQIASIAATNNLVLVTANGDDFRDFEGMRIEDWRN